MLAACLLAVCSARHVQGTGGWDEEEPFTLSATLDQLPAKSFGEIFEETKQPSPATPEPDYDAEINKIAGRIGKDSPEKLTQAVEDLLKSARLHYEDSDNCNFLEDALDVVKGSSKDVRAAQDYLHWRVEHREWFAIGSGNNTDKMKAELEQRLDKAPPGRSRRTGCIFWAR